MSRRSRRGPVDAFPALPQGIQKGMQRLVGDHAATIASMLDISDDSEASLICEKCAQVMKQQQLSASSFLARFFQADMLSQHATDVLQKSGKGSAATLADRIAAEWAKNKLAEVEARPAALASKDDEDKPKSPDKKKTKPSQDEKEKPVEIVTSNSESKKRKSKEEKRGAEAVLMEKIPKKKKK